MASSKISAMGVVTAPVRLALFDPRVTAPLLVALLYCPERLRRIFPTALHPLLASSALIKVLKVCLGLSLIRGLNNKLNQYSANNWKKDAKFIKSQEVVLITGGSSGIGWVMASDFAKKGVKVVVIDLNPPKNPFRKCPRDVLCLSPILKYYIC